MHANVFHINKNAIKAIPTDARLKIDVMGTQLNQAPFIDGVKNEWIWHYKNNWLNMANLPIVIFHNITGAVVKNATTPADSKVLLPAIAGAVADCHPADLRLVGLQLKLDFATLAPDFVGGKILKGMYHLELPQTSVDLANGAGIFRSLVTFHGVADLRTLSIDEIRTGILEEGPYDGPINPSAARDFSTEDTIDDEVCYETITKKIFCMGFEPVLKDLFDQLCPNFPTKPQAHVGRVNMTMVNADENMIALNVNLYNVR